jgi:hypothetical protein
LRTGRPCAGFSYMNCLNNIIGINKTCTEETPESGMYIQDLPGITIKIADAATSEEEVSGVTLIRRKIEFAQNRIVNDLRSFMKDRFNMFSAIEENTIGYYKQDQSSTAVEAGKLKGFRVQLRERPYLQLSIHRIGLKLTSTASTSVYIYDLQNNILLDTIPISGASGEIVYVTLNKSYLTNRQNLSLFVCYDSSVSGVYNSTVYDGYGSGCRTCRRGGNSLTYLQSGYINSASAKTDSNFNSSSTGNGLTVDYSINCTIEPFVCNLSQLLAWPLLFKTGAELMLELKNSRRLNSIVLLDASTNDAMLNYFQDEYEKSMNDIVKNLRLPEDVCFQCDRKITRQIQIP